MVQHGLWCGRLVNLDRDQDVDVKPIAPLMFGIWLTGGLGLGATSLHAETAPKLKAVVELFTSQGCSSCPPADALLGKLANRDDVIALSMPVDYWDYLGWKDTLASPLFSARQRRYAKERGDGQVYTPQVVINGIEHAVGNNEAAIEKTIRQTRAKVAAMAIPLNVWIEGDVVVIEQGIAPAGQKPGKGTLLFAGVQKTAQVSIGRGENEGRKVTYFNVVRELKTLGDWNGDAKTLRLSKNDLMKPGYDFCAVLMQQGTAGPIVAAVEVKGW